MDIVSWLNCDFEVSLTPPAWPISETPRPKRQRSSPCPSPQDRRRVRPRLDDCLSPQPSLSISMAEPSPNDSVSQVSSNTSPLSTRPKLDPKPPSRRKTRSPSPTRKQLALLSKATPPIHIVNPSDPSVPGIPSALELDRAMSENFGVAVIPACFADRVREASPKTFHHIPQSAFDQAQSELTTELQSVWKCVNQAHDEAVRCDRRRKDENAWARVVWNLLELAVSESGTSILEVNSIQSQTVDPAMLPTNFSGESVGRKADFALTFSTSDHQHGFNEPLTNVELAYKVINERFPGITLSPLQDAYTETVALASVVEVKQPGGDMNEAEMQLAVLHAAILRKLSSLMIITGARVALPSLVGWVVVGHKWDCFITSMSADGSIFCEGPMEHLSCTTASFWGLFKLLALLRRACKSAEETLWPTVHSILVPDNQSRPHGPERTM